MGSLRSIGSVLVIAAFFTGAMSAGLWISSVANWRSFQDRAYVSGVTLFHALAGTDTLPPALTVAPLSPADQAAAATGAFSRLSIAPRAPRITAVPLSSASPVGTRTTLIILSSDLVYPLSSLPALPSGAARSPSQMTGDVVRLIATYCSDPVVIASTQGSDWVQIKGAQIWGCAYAPRDWRLLASVLALVALGAILTATLNASAAFSQFAEQLRSRLILGGPNKYAIDGPQELKDIVGAVNAHLETERAQLENRAAVLSGVSHDLGTPATRLRLRTALIPDDELRGKLESDIDAMTGMIESVLSYTRAEMSAEEPRKLSLTSLVQAIVDDYQDMNEPVIYRAPDNVVVHGGRSVFMSRQGQSVVSREGEIVVQGRPISLQRAVTNLVDNALKYGRRAELQLETDANWATVIVDDHGSDTSASDMSALINPFKRGANAASAGGYGLGLTIVSTIASVHGGTLTFEDYPGGLRAKLAIRRT